jgi:peptidoglycan/LPS O-acetylase OafA/YrhL
MFYAVAPFLLRSMYRTLAFALIGLTYYWFVGRFGDQYLQFWKLHMLPTAQIDNLRYYFFPASFIFFGLGALSYHLKARLEGGDWRKAVAIAALTIVLIFVVRPFSSLDWPKTIALFVFLPIVFKFTKSWSIDRTIGDLSYPVYILHFPILTYLRGHTHLSPGPLTVATIVVTLTLAIAVYFAVERPVDSFRERLVRRHL